MDDAIAQQGETLQEITIIDNKANEMATLADKTLANASVAYNLASNTLSAAENLLIDAATPLDDVNVDETRGKMVLGKLCLAKQEWIQQDFVRGRGFLSASSNDYIWST